MRAITCECCNGEGECMRMECYGGPPVEVMGECPDCRGAGELEVADPAPEVVDLMEEVRRLCR